ncbi:hypothetical protein KJ695_03245 [Patescibacteria group bacterium]|nr:hypothetical protein [Patescibacteria group bacterium]
MKKTKIIVAALIIFSAAISGSAGNAGDFVGPTVGISQMDSDSDDRLLGGLKIDLEYLYSGKISDIFVFRFFNSNDMSFRTEEIGIAMKGGGIIIFEGIDKKVYQTEVVNFTVGPRSEYIKLIPIPIAILLLILIRLRFLVSCQETVVQFFQLNFGIPSIPSERNQIPPERYHKKHQVKQRPQSEQSE